MGNLVATTYLDGVQKGQSETKVCEDKNALSNLSRTMKYVEREIPTPQGQAFEDARSSKGK